MCVIVSSMTGEVFTGSFTQQEAIPEAAVSAALEVLRHGRLHRYNIAPDEVAETALFEQEFADFVGVRYCLAVASGGYAMATALRAVGVEPGDRVLSNAFSLAPVPGAIKAVGAEPVLVGVTESLTIDFEDLAAKAGQSKVLLLSHMRGHICDMDRLMDICAATKTVVVEDCAHTMGANWDGIPSGRHGLVSCYSTQTYKHINSGEGGLLVTDDPELAARAVLLSGSYMLFDRHLAAPDAEVLERFKYDTPNISGRMDNLRAAVLRPQLAELPRRVAQWNARYRVLEEGLRGTSGIKVIGRPAREGFVGSSFQFLALDWCADDIREAVRRCAARGVDLKWFGAGEPSAFTSRYDHWRYVASPRMAATDRILAGLLDMRVPLTFSLEDCGVIAGIIRSEMAAIHRDRHRVGSM